MNDILIKIQNDLLNLQDSKYRNFNSALIPTVKKEAFIGVRVPLLREYAKRIKGNNEAKIFLSSLPHKYHEENLLHAILISDIKEPTVLISELDRFLPFIDNWQVCDILSPKIFRKYPELPESKIYEYIKSDKPYTLRFGIKMLMDFFLDEKFKEEYLKSVAEIRSEEYYVNMMISWYFATALAKQYESTLPYLEKRILSPWVHNKTIQKSIESYRVTKEHKEYLKSLRIKK